MYLGGMAEMLSVVINVAGVAADTTPICDGQ